VTLQKARAIAWGVFVVTLAGAFLVPGREARLLVIAWVGSIVVLLAIRSRTKVTSGVAQKPGTRLWIIAVIALGLALADAFASQGLLALALCAAGFLYYLPRALGARPDPALFRMRMVKAGVTIGAGAAAFGAIALGNRIAEERAGKVIAAVESFKVKRGGYPDKLEQLVPVFLPAVPPAKPFGMLREFQYRRSPADGQHTLTYTVIAPFGRRLYHFEEQRWSALD